MPGCMGTLKVGPDQCKGLRSGGGGSLIVSLVVDKIRASAHDIRISTQCSSRSRHEYGATYW